MSLKDDSEDQILKAAACTAGKQELFLTCSDRISDLPDDILIRIISSLTLKQAGATSVLSKRWTYVWTGVPSLIFDASEIVRYIKRRPKSHQQAKYLRWIDQVLSSHKAHTVDEFRINFHFLTPSYDKFDDWLRFAMEKRVKKLELNILPLGPYVTGWLSYTLPSLTPWNPLTSLELTFVDMTEHVLQKFLSGCPNLELLSLAWVESLVNLKIVGALNLKSFTLLECRSIQCLEISAPNLISFHYSGDHISWPLKYTPKLTELHIGSSYAQYLLSDDCSDLSSCFSQLEVLILGPVYVDQPMSKVFPVAPRLKLLNVMIWAKSDEELFGLSSLIKACPLLHKFELELDIHGDMKMTTKTREAQVIPHHNLKILEISRFTGCDLDMGFAMHLIKTFVSVEKIIVKANAYIRPLRPSRLKAKEEAERLSTVVKAGTDLEIVVPYSD